MSFSVLPDVVSGIFDAMDPFHEYRDYLTHLPPVKIDLSLQFYLTWESIDGLVLYKGMSAVMISVMLSVGPWIG